MLKNFTTITATAILLSGCGGGGSTETPSSITTLKLTVGNTTIDSSSTLSRITSTITDTNKNISIVKINKAGTISISGEDSDLFELTDITKGKQLSFVTKPDASSPTDANQDGIYNIDIKAQDNDNQIATYKVAYKILVPRTTLEILNGNTYYVDLGDNNYTKVTYDSSAFTTQSYSNTEAVGSTETIAVTYNEDNIQFNDLEKITCIVQESSSLVLTCSAEGQTAEVKVTYLDTAPEFIAPASYTLSATNANTNNHSDSISPKISTFSVTGNAPSENDKVIISQSKLSGKFSYSVTLNDDVYADQLQSGLMDGNKSIVSTYSFGRSNTLNFDCVFNKDNGEDQGIDYTCKTISVQNTQGNADTSLGMIVCDKEVNATDAKCSVATVPVLFID